jgi:hypothetical protein
LRRGYFGVMRMTQNLKTTNATMIGVQVMVTPRTVTCAVAWVDVIDFAVATLGCAANSLASIFCASLGGRSSEPPNVIALPLASAFV